jgi:hypothetical protein
VVGATAKSCVLVAGVKLIVACAELAGDPVFG